MKRLDGSGAGVTGDGKAWSSRRSRRGGGGRRVRRRIEKKKERKIGFLSGQEEVESLKKRKERRTES